ncbi:MAG: NAD(+) synthase, partial [Thermoplasmata archaeon]|nr:NAD(+) synthase [Thermoplasmata archaeon]
MRFPYDPGWTDILAEHIRAGVERSGARGVVVGLSGGLDSSLVLALAVKALGADKVLSVHMPTPSTPEEDGRHAEEHANSLGVEYGVIEIGDIWKMMKKLGGEYGGTLEKT